MGGPTPRPARIADCNKTERDILWALLRGPCTGSEMVDRLEHYYGEPVNNSRIYRNFESLHEREFVEIEEEGRANRYELSDTGRNALGRRLAWIRDLRRNPAGTDLIEQ